MLQKNLPASALLSTRCLFFLAAFLVIAAPVCATEFVAKKDRLTLSDLNKSQLAFISKLKPKQLENLVTVAVLDEQGQLLGQVWGDVTLANNQLQFTPRFPFDDNQVYFARFQLGRDGVRDVLSERFIFSSDNRKPIAAVEQIFPSGEVLPENLFKFYIIFSHPMSRGEAYQHIRLLDQHGEAVELPFLQLTQELWDPDGKRFTLLFDPGRTKKGIKPNRDMGLPLQEGQQFTLVIDQDWHDAQGLPLQRSFAKTFTVGPQDHHQPDINAWQLTLPNGGSRNPVIVTFDEPLDRGQLENALWIESAEGNIVNGKIDIEDEIVWRFTPAFGWRSGNYRLVARSYLEDRAANSLGRLFEVIRTEEDPKIPDTYSLEFSLDSES